MSKKVFVAMSGGVDSSVAAALLKEAGYDIEGITMCFSITYPDKKKPSCCGVEGIEDARQVSKVLNIPHHVMDFAADIDDFIIKDFISEYQNGRTPNPCVRCNQYLKFGTLYKMVMNSGADCLATGHYAMIDFNADIECYELRKAKDKSKDQSYFLYGIKKDALQNIMFPLGGIEKKEVRNIAKKYKLNIADKPESQDICFVSDGGYKQFIKDRIGESACVPGIFKNHIGEDVGEHKGVINYTIGQRDKLGLAFGYPVYVYKIDMESNTVYVGPKEYLLCKGLKAKQYNFINIEAENTPVNVRMRIRYNAPEIEGVLRIIDSDNICVDFKENQMAVTPGQSVVFYDGDVVLGGAIIEKAIPCDNNIRI